MRAAVLALLIAACGGGAVEIGPDIVPDPDARAIDASPPIPAGCVTDVSTGDHTYTCGGLSVDARIPAACQAPGCGLILVLHGDTGNGLLMDAHIKMRELGAANGYIVIAPTGPPRTDQGSTWTSANDATLVDMTTQFRDVFRVNPKKVHVTGFSRGGFVTWRLLCDHSDLFASAAPSGAGFGNSQPYDFNEQTCFEANRAPSRKIAFTFLMGRTDMSVGYTPMVNIRNAAITNYGATGPTVLASDPNYTHNRWTGTNGVVIETWDHAYENYPTSQFAYSQGHCIVGSTTSPTAPQYAIPCEPPNAFVWGEEVMKFFMANPMP